MHYKAMSQEHPKQAKKVRLETMGHWGIETTIFQLIQLVSQLHTI